MRAATAFPAGLLAALLALAGPAQAQRLYLCKDATGRTLTSDQPIPECSAQSVREIDRNGIVRREIAAPLTPEQKQRRIEEAARERAEREALAEQRRTDRALLARFHSEAEIEAERRAHVDRVREHAAREAQELERARQHRAALEAKLSTSGKATPELLLQLREADRAVDTSRRRLDDHEAETMQIDARIDAMLKRFRELKSTPQNP